MKKINSKQKGFTLYELVVVAGIILLLTSIVLSRLDLSRAKGRDSQKITELKTLQTALELYQLEAGGYPQQPTNGPAKNSESNSTMSTTLQGIVTAGYLSAIPKPPKGISVLDGNIYYYQTADVSTVDPNTGVTYTYEPSCDGRRLGSVPYIIYFVAETPQRLSKLSNRGIEIPNGYCLTL
jgi:prepilin-type N-terminal cleavage/methylation domain-containing protein